MKDHLDVVVVGAGPVGLLTAVELALGGVRVLVLERLAAVSPITKALGIGPLGSEALQRRGMAGAITGAEARSLAAAEKFTAQSGSSLWNRRSQVIGHFAGLFLIRKDAQREPERSMRLVDQQTLEAILAERAFALGVEIRRECEVTAFTSQAESIQVEWASPTGEGHIRCAWLIGCDGGRSSVRKMAGFDFPGTPPTMTMYQAVVEIDQAERPLPTGWNHTSGGMFAYGPFPGRLIMGDFSGPPQDREAPVTREEVEAVLRRISADDVHVKAVESGRRWTDNTRLVDTYRRGRVFLAGDAAHIHSPFGGQGLSLGLVDAANLGWKLAAVIRGDMPESLLDTYTAERRPVAEAVLANTLAQVAIMRPDPQSTAMRDIVAKLMQFDDVSRFFGEMMSSLSISYDLESEHDDVGRLIGNRSIHQGDEQVSLYDLMQDGKGVLLDASSATRASKLVAAATPRVRCVAVDQGPSMLIRPDACVAWIGEGDIIDGLEQVLRRWFVRAKGEVTVQ
jgi:2-polyprenyl-6-methoxyphenol hydroxylase-like FAD-dependent oxidoreductase